MTLAWQHPMSMCSLFPWNQEDVRTKGLHMLSFQCQFVDLSAYSALYRFTDTRGCVCMCMAKRKILHNRLVDVHVE